MKWGESMASVQGREELLDSLVDIRTVKIDSTQPVEERMKSYVQSRWYGCACFLCQYAKDNQ